MSADVSIFILAIIFFAAAVHGITGFGFAMILVMLLPYFGVDYLTLLSIISFFSVGIGLLYTIAYRKHIVWSYLPYTLISCIVLDYIAILILKHYQHLNWYKFLGVFLIALTLFMVFLQNKISIKPSIKNGLVAGSIGGFLEGIFGIGGPPIVIYYLAVSKNNKYQYIASTQAYFAVLCTFDLAFRLHLKMIDISLSGILLPGLVCLVLGIIVGTRLLNMINPLYMKYAIYALLFLNGITLLFR